MSHKWGVIAVNGSSARRWRLKRTWSSRHSRFKAANSLSVHRHANDGAARAAW
jgi:hypothetical protein